MHSKNLGRQNILDILKLVHHAWKLNAFQDIRSRSLDETDEKVHRHQNQTVALKNLNAGNS